MLCFPPSSITEIKSTWPGMDDTTSDSWREVRAEAYKLRSAGVESFLSWSVGQRLGGVPTCRIAACLTPNTQASHELAMHSANEILGRPAYKPRPGDVGYQNPALVDLEDLLRDSPRNHEIPSTESDVVAHVEPDIENHWSDIEVLGNFGTAILFDGNSLFDDEFPIEEPGQRDIDIQRYPAQDIFFGYASATDDPGLNVLFDGERNIENHWKLIFNITVDDEIPIGQPGMSFSGISLDEERLLPLSAEMSETSFEIPEDIAFE